MEEKEVEVVRKADNAEETTRRRREAMLAVEQIHGSTLGASSTANLT